ncbi:helix-turn-helix transcriptional regulator [Amycolatopsis sp. NPDC024027]|uniref:helix-turn-helix domain-containing protein n=1 Tax=Amycolatopsis sp. NPDC024027 TaxID=3154327 RepID=UPI0033C788EA
MSQAKPRPALARRLRELREKEWPDAGITQSQLAAAIGGAKPLSVSLISSWENIEKPVTPPIKRLDAYATLFATRRSVEGGSVRVLPLENLTDDERKLRDDLLVELMKLRGGEESAAAPLPDVWRFPEGEDITIVCAPLPAKYREHLTYANPESADFVTLYTYADPDALIVLFGHIRSRNPDNLVTFKTSDELVLKDYTSHLILLGGVDFNKVTRDVIERVADLPVEQVAREADAEHGGFRVKYAGRSELFEPKLDRAGRLLEDVAHFYRGVSPFNQERTVTVCNGMYGRGTLGAVRALTDPRFRDRNQDYIRSRFRGADSFSVISRVLIVAGNGLTPDWTIEDNVLHEWSKADE